MIPEDNLPQITDIQVASGSFFDNSVIQAAFVNDKPIDLSKDFLPFGEHPKVGDTLYLMSPAFGRSQSSPTLAFQATDSYAIAAFGKPIVNWEYWNGSSWMPIKVDSTNAFTQSGTVNALITGDPQPRTNQWTYRILGSRTPQFGKLWFRRACRIGRPPWRLPTWLPLRSNP